MLRLSEVMLHLKLWVQQHSVSSPLWLQARRRHAWNKHHTTQVKVCTIMIHWRRAIH